MMAGGQAIVRSLRDHGVDTVFGIPGIQLDKLYDAFYESRNARFRDELLNGEIFYSLKEAQTIIKQWRKHYNTKRPHSAPGYRPLAPEAIVPMDQRSAMH